MSISWNTTLKLKERNLHTHTNYLKKIKKETNSLYNNILKLDSFEHVAVYWKEEVRHEIVHISEKKTSYCRDAVSNRLSLMVCSNL